VQRVDEILRAERRELDARSRMNRGTADQS
jgi:hypothetical protein